MTLERIEEIDIVFYDWVSYRDKWFKMNPHKRELDQTFEEFAQNHGVSLEEIAEWQEFNESQADDQPPTIRRRVVFYYFKLLTHVPPIHYDI